LFILIVVLSGFVVFIGLQRSKKELAQPTVTTTPLTQEALDQLKGSDTKVGDAKQTLSIESNAIFSGGVLVKGSLDVAGAIKVGGALNLPGITVSGASSFDQINANKLAVAGDSSIQGALNVQSSLTVAGGGQFGGPVSAPQITVQSLVLLNDLAISRHIDAGGGTPGKTDGSALGSGGTSSVGGTDTAGTLTINTGGGPGPGCFATVNFAQKFNAVPHVVITPVGSAAAGLNYYINRTTSGFSICTTNPAPAGVTFSFDWIAID
jgi:cytoskeletal protein CcmA (bactofilin family)